MRTHGDPGWESFPSYLDLVVPRVLGFLARRGLRITFFVVGQDAALPGNRRALADVASAGHEIGNHSFNHLPWLHLFSEAEIEAELAQAEEAIAAATGQRPRGFRGPGFSLSAATLRVLSRRGYRYDATTLPTFIGPLARAYYLLGARLRGGERQRRRRLFGTFREGLRPLAPYHWRLGEQRLLEIPVTTLPVLRTPIHLSYLLYIGGFSPALARRYLRLALALCRQAGIGPSLLLHPLDFLGADEVPELAFFPAMRRPAEQKLREIGEHLAAFCQSFHVVSVGEHADSLLRQAGVGLAEQPAAI
ncbi:MAG: polysaccharide deacetylase family protein [Acidobacteria bacterium]|nr:polysaccharide deacetylase family protein [Acidobacteriota bacterium]